MRKSRGVLAKGMRVKILRWSYVIILNGRPSADPSLYRPAP